MNRRLLLPLMVATLLSACTHWKTTEMSPRQAVAEKDWVLLTTSDGDKIMIVDPMISDGQIVGHPVRGRFAVKSDTVRVPLDSVAHVQVREIHAAATTVGAVVGLAVAAGITVVVVALATYY